MMHSSFRPWMLPEGVIESLPAEAEKLNTLSHTALSIFSRWGYQPLRPPMMEYADTFTGHNHSDDLAEQTIQFKDQKSGKQIGLRPDITPQIARIDAHYLPTDQVARYGYAGEVLRSYPANHGSSRNPSVVGAELLGSASQQADIEIVSLLISYLESLELPPLTIELGNIDIVIELLTSAGLDESQFPPFFDSLAIKDKEKLTTLCAREQLSQRDAQCLVAMTECYGDDAVLAQAMTIFDNHPAVLAEIKRLNNITAELKQQHNAITFHVDLADVRGYGYHNGLIFSAYVNGVWQAIARGGRYDSFGNHFGDEYHLRPSTGFSCNLNLLAPLLPASNAGRIIACDLPYSSTALAQYLADLRTRGDTVIQLFDDGSGTNRNCTHKIVQTVHGFDVINVS